MQNSDIREQRLMYSVLLRISYFLLLFLLVFVPLAFGTVETWSLTILEIFAPLGFLLLGIPLLSTQRSGLKVPGMLPLVLFIGYMFLQLVPLPAKLVEFLSPQTYALYRPLLDYIQEPRFIPLSLHPRNTLLLLLAFSSYGLVYLMTIYHCSRPERLKRTTAVVATLGVLIAVEAILQKLTSPDAIYWFRPTPNSSPVGPWVYSNHFAGYMEMLFPVVIGLFLYHRPQVSTDISFRDRFIAALTLPGANRYLLLGTGAILMAVSILFSISRGGIITLSLAFLFFVLFSARTTENSRTRWAMVITIFVVLMVSWLGWQPIIDKFGRILNDAGLDTSGRLPVLLDSIKLFLRFPVFGSGFGTFIDLYPAVRSVPGEAVFDHAHNDYIELLVTGGAIGFLLCGWFLLAIFSHAFSMLLQRRDRYALLVGGGALTGILALLFHCLVDFQIYNGANGLYLFFLCGLAVAAAGTRLQFRTRPSLLKKAGKPTLILPILFALGMLFLGGWYSLAMSRADKIGTAVIADALFSRTRERLTTMHAQLTRAGRLDPLNADYPSLQGRLSMLLKKNERARQEYLQACLLNPASGRYIQQFALSLDREQEAKKNALLALALDYRPHSPPLYFTYCDWLLQKNMRKRAFAVMNLALEKIPWRTTEIIDYMLPYRFTIAETDQMLAPLPRAWYEAGLIMQKLGRTDDAETFYLRAAETAVPENAQPVFFDRLYNFYRQRKEDTKGMEMLQRGISMLPDYAPFRIRMGDYYRKEGIFYRAEEEYRQALRLDPDNISVRRKLEELANR